MASIQMYATDTRSFTLTVTLEGVAQNITGWELYMTAKLALTDSDSTAVFKKAIGTGITITDGPNGVARITLAFGDTATFASAGGVLFYDIRSDNAGKWNTLESGKITIKPVVLRSLD